MLLHKNEEAHVLQIDVIKLSIEARLYNIKLIIINFVIVRFFINIKINLKYWTS